MLGPFFNTPDGLTVVSASQFGILAKVSWVAPVKEQQYITGNAVCIV